MEKDIDKIPKNPDTDIVIRIDDFGGKRGLTIREFVKGERYTGFTKAGTRIPVEQFSKFKEAINSIDEGELMADMPSDSSDDQQGLDSSGQEDKKEDEKSGGKESSGEESGEKKEEVAEQAM
jgi:hypothetical protein